jgi:hypothetical protein
MESHVPGRTTVASLFGVIALAALTATAGAQAPPRVSDSALPPSRAADAPRVVELTPAQRLAIYQSITQTHKNSAAPIGFQVAVGAHVPDSVELKPLSDTLAKLVPQARDFSIGMIEKQVILVDPGSRQVVAVVTQEPATVVH